MDPSFDRHVHQRVHCDPDRMTLRAEPLRYEAEAKEPA
jgi:hypothetical protein